LPGERLPVSVIAWKDPTLVPENPKLRAGYLITDTLWSAKALKVINPAASQEMEKGLQQLGWYGNGLHDVLFHPVDWIRHRPADQDFVHGFSLGRFPITHDRIVDLRVFRQQSDAEFTLGHPSLFAEHAVYQALFDFWQGRTEQARRRILEAIHDNRTRNSKDRIFWDEKHGILVDHVNYEEWLGVRAGDRRACRHFTFKLGVLLYAIRLLGLEPELVSQLKAMRQRLWNAQTEHGGVAHFLDVQADGHFTRGLDATGEATAIATLSETVTALLPSVGNENPRRSHSPFSQRGYYITFMRMPTYDLADWNRILDGIASDGGNTLLLWVAGAFRSRNFPVTWQYNNDHENIRHDFVRDLISQAHTRGIKVLLGFTPFGYDGVNQYPLEHPETRAVGKDGKPIGKAGIGGWSYNLCPSQPESQRFMLDYVREMLAFYPNADGLLVESSDYAICHCQDCGPRFVDKEYGFVRRISHELWSRKPDSVIVVYPHYFSGSEVPGFGVKAAKQPFDPRWTLFFTPHSAHLEPDLIKKARSSLWWDDSPALRRPHEIQQGARRAREAGVTGYVPSLEAYSFIATQAEEGHRWLKGRRQVPLGFGWLAPGDPPYDELPVRVNRIAYREFSRNPDLPMERFREVLGREVFGDASSPQSLNDLLTLQAIFAIERTWCQPSPLVSPERVRAMKERGDLSPKRRAEYREALDRLRAVGVRHDKPTSDGEKQLHRITRWALDLWSDEDRKLLAAPADQRKD
jgi:hypothetical protein